MWVNVNGHYYSGHITDIQILDSSVVKSKESGILTFLVWHTGSTGMDALEFREHRTIYNQLKFMF